MSFLSRFLDNYSEQHWNAGLRVLRYLQETTNLAIVYSGGGFSRLQESFKTFTDADFATDKISRRSVSGSVTVLNGGPILWFSRQQKNTCLSTTEAEYVAATEGAKDALWLIHLFKELKLHLKPSIHIDNVSALRLVKNPEFHARTKHVDTKLQFIRETFENGQITYHYVPTDRQLADILTKPLNRVVHSRLVSLIGLRPCTPNH